MKKLTKRVLILFIVGIAGMAIMFGIIYASGILISRDNTAVKNIDEQVELIDINVEKADVVFVPTENERRIEAYTKYWTGKEIDVWDIAIVETQDNVLMISEKQPEATFLGIFPQPYELKITIYAPQDMIDDRGETE